MEMEMTQPIDYYSEQEEILPYNQLSDAQEKILAILPIPSAFLSVCGGLLVVTTALRSRKDRPWTPYQGLQTSLGICNILASLTMASGAFLYPSGTSNQVWAFGNSTSCTASGFFGQLGTSALVYNGMLSFFFLLRLRFEHNVTAITQKFEPLMHIVAVGYPLVTAFLGLFFDAYGERVVSHTRTEEFVYAANTITSRMLTPVPFSSCIVIGLPWMCHSHLSH